MLGKQGAEAFDKGKDWLKSSQNLKLGKQKSRLAGLQQELILQLHAQEKNSKNLLTNARGQAIIVVDRVELTGEPNSITQITRENGGIDRNYYGPDGRQTLQVSNNDHGKPKAHPFGEKGEHAHTYSYSEDGTLIRGKQRALTPDEREANGDFL